MNNKTKKWIEAGRTLAQDPFALVTCPECETGKLIVKDEPIRGRKEVDRYLICDSCRRFEVLGRLDPQYKMK